MLNLEPTYMDSTGTVLYGEDYIELEETILGALDTASQSGADDGGIDGEPDHVAYGDAVLAALAKKYDLYSKPE